VNFNAHHELVIELESVGRPTIACVWVRCHSESEQLIGVTNKKVCSSLILMGDVDESARLWKVNRTIHELVKDRVSYHHSNTMGCINLIILLGLSSRG